MDSWVVEVDPTIYAKDKADLSIPLYGFMPPSLAGSLFTTTMPFNSIVWIHGFDGDSVLPQVVEDVSFNSIVWIREGHRDPKDNHYKRSFNSIVWIRAPATSVFSRGRAGLSIPLYGF